MKKQLADALRVQHVDCLASAVDKIQFGYAGSRPVMHIEQGVQFREGAYDLERIGAFTYLGGNGSLFRHISSIGRFCSIAGAVITGQVEHPLDMLSTHPLFYSSWERVWPGYEPLEAFRRDCAAGYQQGVAHARDYFAERAGKIEIGNDVWIGYGAFIRRGVKIGDGAVIASHAVVTKDVPPYAVVGGMPAKVIRYRFEPEVIKRLLALRWWDYGLAAMDGVDFCDINQALNRLEVNVGRLPLWRPPVVKVRPDDELEVVTFPETWRGGN